jgi:hypothetical protein
VEGDFVCDSFAMNAAALSRAAKLTYRVALAAFVIVWVIGVLAGVDADGSSPLYAAWVLLGVLGLGALVVWLAGEFIAGRRDQT